MLADTRIALGHDWKPAGSALEGDLTRLSQFKAVFGSSARKFLLLSTSPPPKLAETGQVKTLPLF